MPIGLIFSHALALVIGAVAGGFIHRNNPLKAAKTEDEIAALAAQAKADLQAKLAKNG